MRLPNVLVSDTFLAVARWLAVKSSVTYIISKVGDGRPTLFRQQPGLAAGCKAWLNEGDAIVGEFFERLGVAKDELVEIYTGYVLEGVRAWLASSGYNWRQTKITGPLQVLAETTLLGRLHQLGLTDLDYETLTKKQGLLFWHCLRWLKGGNLNATRVPPAREKFAETGWATYPIWANHPYQEAKALAKKAKARRRR